MKQYPIFLKPFIACMSFLLIGMQTTLGQTGYLYVHTKSLSEDLNRSFNFSVSGGSTSVPGFTLSDQSLNIEPTDIGAGHGTGGGELWAVAGATGGANGPIYHRAPNSTTWKLVSGQAASSIDGADLGHCAFVNTNGDAYVYNGSTFKKIFNHTSMGSNAVDIANSGSIASGIGVTAIVDNNGHVWKYTGNYTSTTTWIDITPTDNSGGSFTRLDINPTTNDIVLIDGNADVTKINTSGTGLVYYGSAGSPVWPNTDVAVDNNGTMYDIQHNSAANYDAVYRYNGTVWVPEPQMQEHFFLTCGDAGQVWCAKGYPAAQYSSMANASSIFTRTGDGTATWFDDERVQVSQNGNSIIIPVTAGTYTITEANVPNWNLLNITVYDSTSGSATNVSGNSAKIVVSPGQVAHVVFTNGIVSPLAIPSGCGITNIIQNFGSGTANLDGSPLSGKTDYHYFGNAALKTGDGYYSLQQTSAQWANNSLTDHTGLTNGYFMVINASYAANEFYRQRVTGLLPGATYMFTFWAANLSTTSPQQPNILAGIADTSSGAILGSMSTGMIPSDNSWHSYTFIFTASVTTGDFFLQNNAPGGNGNDLALDDIGITQVCSVLPQTLINFKAVKQANNSLISWATTNNLRFDHFEIERSADGSAWSSIATVTADDTSNIQNDYSYTDHLPLNGINYYRVNGAASNGIWLYSDIKMLQFSSDGQWKVSMYPNPVNSGEAVNIQSNEALQMIRVFDINGRLALVKNFLASDLQGNASYALNANSLPQGMYLVQMANSNGMINSLKFIKKD